MQETVQTTPVPLDVGPGSRMPIFRQIEEQIADAILDGRLQPGDRLASSQALAEQLVVSPVAAAKAYRDLVDSGLCQSVEGGLRVGELIGEPRQLARHRATRREAVGALIDRGFSAEELELAREVQRRLLPPPHIQGNGFAVTARCLPARYVAGDFYDVIPHSDGSVGLTVADVAGKGVASGLITASVKAILPFVTEQRDVDEVLRELNRRLYCDLGAREFVAMSSVRFEPQTGRLRMANAGMPSPYLLVEGERPRELSGPSPRLPLGLSPEVQYQAVEMKLEMNERLLLLSDGMPEARGSAGEPLGYERFEELLLENAFETDLEAGDWLDRLLAAVHTAVNHECPGQQLQNDDWTVLLLERRAEARGPEEN